MENSIICLYLLSRQLIRQRPVQVSAARAGRARGLGNLDSHSAARGREAGRQHSMLCARLRTRHARILGSLRTRCAAAGPILGHRANPAGTAPADHRQRTPVGPWISDPGRIGLQTGRMHLGCYLRRIINPDCLIAIKIRIPAQPFIKFQYLNIPG